MTIRRREFVALFSTAAAACPFAARGVNLKTTKGDSTLRPTLSACADELIQ